MASPRAALWAIIQREYLERVRSRWFVIGTVIAPLIFLGILVGPSWLSGQRHAAQPDCTPTPPPSTLVHPHAAKLVFATFVAFFLYMSIVLYGQSMLSGVIEEKLSRVAEIVVSSVRPEILLAGKVIGVSAVGLTQQCLWVLTSAAIVLGRDTVLGSTPDASVHIPTTVMLDAIHALPNAWLLLVLLFFVLGFLFFGALYAAVGSTVSSESDARQVAQPITLLLVATVIFTQSVIFNPNSTVSRATSIIPFSAPIIMPLRMAITDVPLSEVIASVVLLALACAGAIWTAARIYRVGLLMYGKRPTMREMVRWVRM